MRLNRFTSSSILLIILALLLVMPSLVSAKTVCCSTGIECSPSNACAGGETCGGLCNPLGSRDMSLLDFWIRILQLMLGGVGLFGVMMFIYGGFIMLTSGGNPDKVKKAKDTLVWAVLGLVTIFVSGAAVKYLFDNFKF